MPILVTLAISVKTGTFARVRSTYRLSLSAWRGILARSRVLARRWGLPSSISTTAIVNFYFVIPMIATSLACCIGCHLVLEEVREVMRYRISGLLTVREKMKFVGPVGVGLSGAVPSGVLLGAVVPTAFISRSGLWTTTGIALTDVSDGFVLVSLAPAAIRTFAAASETTIPFVGSMIDLRCRGLGGLFGFKGPKLLGFHARPACSASSLIFEVGRSAAAT